MPLKRKMGIHQEGLVSWYKEQVKGVASQREGGGYTLDRR